MCLLMTTLHTRTSEKELRTGLEERFVTLSLIILLHVQKLKANSPGSELRRYGGSIIRDVLY